MASVSPVVSLSHITGDYARTLGLRVIRGRLLSAADGAETVRSALINETLASRQFSNDDPIGKRIRIGRGQSELWTVVGVVSDVKNFETIEAAEPQLYLPFAQQPRRAMTVVLRSSGTARGP